MDKFEMQAFFEWCEEHLRRFHTVHLTTECKFYLGLEHIGGWRLIDGKRELYIEQTLEFNRALYLKECMGEMR